ncbi:MAG TPA: hypothetical protein VI796_03535 [Candidatus Thermoplasmatota archaeon]|nr:hypothetical protein [Candidatus Thermoplasmatota archaeon]
MTKAFRLATLTTALLFLGTLFTMVPMATAQVPPEPSFTFTIGNRPASPIRPLEESVNVDFNWVYTVKGTVLQANLGSTTGAAVATFTVQCTPDQVVIAGALDAIIPLSPSGSTDTYEGTVTISITPTREAPGLIPISCEVVGSVASVGGTAIPASNEKRDSFTLTPDFFSLIEASVPVKLRKAGPDKPVNYVISLTNFGNSQTRISFEILDGPGGRWDGLLPDQVILDPQGGERSTVEANFLVSTTYKNGWNNAKESYTLVMKPTYALDSEKKGPEIQTTILTRVRGVYIPALEPMLMIGAVLGAAMLLRLRDEEE